MKFALLQDEILVPTFGGGVKANRCLLEELAAAGHECVAITRALTRSSDGPNDIRGFQAALTSRGIQLEPFESHVWFYDYRGVQVEALDFEQDCQRGDYLTRRLKELAPDWVIVTDDKRRFMLQSALDACPDRVVLLLQTIIQLPFGPLSVAPSSEYSRLLRKTRGIAVISQFMQDYMRCHGQVSARRLNLPVYGRGPFRELGQFGRGLVTVINPCQLKGVEIFLALADAFPEADFGAVPTWGTSTTLLDRLHSQSNVQILEPHDDVEEILTQTSILLVPSLWPETFGYVVPEAMLRGIPVLASDVGGLPEAKLGVDYVLPVVPGRFNGQTFEFPTQNIEPWKVALGNLLHDQRIYRRCADQSRAAATQFVRQVSADQFTQWIESLESSSPDDTT